MLLSWPTAATMQDKQITLYLHLFLNAQVLCCYLHKREKSAKIWVLLALFSIFPLSVSVSYLVEGTWMT